MVSRRQAALLLAGLPTDFSHPMMERGVFNAKGCNDARPD
jgi:hypothetical protein